MCNTRCTFASRVAMVAALVDEHETRLRPLTAKPLPNAASVALCVWIPCSSPCCPLLPCILCTLWCLQVPNRPTCTAPDRCHSLSHMPTQLLPTHPSHSASFDDLLTLAGRNRSTICGNTRCTFASTVVAMVAALVDEHETRRSPSYSQTTAQCSQCCTVCVVFHAVALALPLLPCILCTLWCLQVPNRPTCTAPDHVSIA